MKITIKEKFKDKKLGTMLAGHHDLDEKSSQRLIAEGKASAFDAEWKPENPAKKGPVKPGYMMITVKDSFRDPNMGLIIAGNHEIQESTARLWMDQGKATYSDSEKAKREADDKAKADKAAADEKEKLEKAAKKKADDIAKTQKGVEVAKEEFVAAQELVAEAEAKAKTDKTDKAKKALEKASEMAKEASDELEKAEKLLADLVKE